MNSSDDSLFPSENSFPPARSEDRLSDEETALARLVELYPLAFALASASGFRTGLGLRHWASNRPVHPRSEPDHFAASVSEISGRVSPHSEAPARAVVYRQQNSQIETS